MQAAKSHHLIIINIDKLQIYRCIFFSSVIIDSLPGLKIIIPPDVSVVCDSGVISPELLVTKGSGVVGPGALKQDVEFSFLMFKLSHEHELSENC